MIILNDRFATDEYEHYTVFAHNNSRLSAQAHARALSNGEWQPAMVNWASIGSVTPQEARDFAALIIAASYLADQMNISKNIVVPKKTASRERVLE